MIYSDSALYVLTTRTGQHSDRSSSGVPETSANAEHLESARHADVQSWSIEFQQLNRFHEKHFNLSSPRRKGFIMLCRQER